MAEKSLMEVIDKALDECDRVIFEMSSPLCSTLRIKLFKRSGELPNAHYVDIPIDMRSLEIRVDNRDLCVAEEVKIGIAVLHKSICQERIRLLKEARDVRPCPAP